MNRMKKVRLLGVFSGITLTLYSQKKELTLKDAVLAQYRMFGSDRIFGFQWLDGDTYAFLNKSFQTLYKSSVDAKADEEWLTIKQLNELLGTALPSFAGMEWKNGWQFYINDGEKKYLFDTKTRKGFPVFELSKDAENQCFHFETASMAFTVENNVYIQTSDGKKITVTNHADKNIVSGQGIARNEFGISGGLFWSNSGQFLAFYQKDETEVHDYPLLDIQQTPGVLQKIKYPMAGQKSEKPSVGIFNLRSGKTIHIKPRGAVDDYLTNLVFTPDNNYVLIAEVNRAQNHLWLNVYDVLTGNFVKTLLEETNEKWVEPEHPAFFPSEKSTNFVWMSEKDGFNNLYYYDFSGKLIRQLTTNTFVAKDIIGASKDGSTVFYSATGPNAMNTLCYSVQLPTGKQRLLTTVSGTHDVQFSSDKSYFLDVFSNHEVPYKAVVYSAKGQQLKLILEGKDKLGDVKIGSAEIKVIDGVSTLYTRLIKPSNFDPSKKYPVLVYVYGGPHAQMITNSWLDGANLWMYWLAEQGYLVFTVDGRGSAYRGFYDESQIHRQLGTVEMEDQLRGVAYLKSLSFVDSNRLALHGWSFGGFMTTSLMLRHPGVFKVGVAGGPVTDWKYYEVMYGERYMDRPEENPKGYEQACLLTHAGNLKGDLLLIHGTSDDVVVMQHNYALVKKFVDLGIQMDFFPYPMHKHNVSGKDRVHLMQKVLTYIIENNK
jgi:dipeptidyl-peptidase-4